MNTKTSLPLVVAALLAALGGVDCNRNDPPADPTTTEIDPSNATDVGPTAASDPLPAPPELKDETPGPAPSENDAWIEGYWWWDAPKHDYVWSPGFWQDRTVQPTVAPPALVYENPYRAPSELYAYVPGYWMWRGAEYAWFHGYWAPHHDGWAYLHPYWEARGGRWGCVAWGWERYHTGWESEHVGFEFHVGVWEQSADFQARVTLARGHASDYRVAPGTWHGHVYGRADADAHGHVAGAAGANGTVYPGDSLHEDRGVRPVHTGHPSERHTAEPHPSEDVRRGPNAGTRTTPHHYDTHPGSGHHPHG
jgi:hypothetical protein